MAPLTQSTPGAFTAQAGSAHIAPAQTGAAGAKPATAQPPGTRGAPDIAEEAALGVLSEACANKPAGNVGPPMPVSQKAPGTWGTPPAVTQSPAVTPPPGTRGAPDIAEGTAPAAPDPAPPAPLNISKDAGSAIQYVPHVSGTSVPAAIQMGPLTQSTPGAFAAQAGSAHITPAQTGAAGAKPAGTLKPAEDVGPLMPAATSPPGTRGAPSATTQAALDALSEVCANKPAGDVGPLIPVTCPPASQEALGTWGVPPVATPPAGTRGAPDIAEEAALGALNVSCPDPPPVATPPPGTRGTPNIAEEAALGVLNVSCPDPAPAATRAAADFIDAINALRLERGLHTLRVDDSACRAAAAYAAQLAERMVLSHRGLDGSRVAQRYLQQGGTGRLSGENLGAGNSLSAIMEGWLNSPSHRQNMLNPRWYSFGTGTAPLPKGRLLAVAVFTDSRWQTTAEYIAESEGRRNLILEGRFYYCTQSPPQNVFILSGTRKIYGTLLNRAGEPRGPEITKKTESRSPDTLHLEFVIPLETQPDVYIPLSLWHTDSQGRQRQSDMLIFQLENLH